MSEALFDVIREIKRAGGPGAKLTQAEVDAVNRVLGGDALRAATGGMRTSDEGKRLIHSFESCQLRAYRDPGPTGLPITIGWGSTTDEQGRPIKLGDVWTQERADARFAADLARFETAVNTLIAGAPTSQGQFDALVSFAYNVGADIDADDKAEGLGDSTLLRKHLAGDYAGAKAEFAKWNRAKGKVLAGLTRRRAAEATLYGGGR